MVCSTDWYGDVCEPRGWLEESASGCSVVTKLLIVAVFNNFDFVERDTSPDFLEESATCMPKMSKKEEKCERDV